MKQSRELIESIVKENKVWKFEEDCQNSAFAQVVYGITTGFGKFARTVIEKDKLAELQVNEKKHLTILFSTAMYVPSLYVPEKVTLFFTMMLLIPPRLHIFFRPT